MIEILSIDLSNYCSKQCPFCYNHSSRNSRGLRWKPQEVIDFTSDCVAHGIKAVSLGGGEPFEYEGIFEVIDALYNRCYLSVTTNGLPLQDESIWNELMLHQPDKVHFTIHYPNEEHEVARVLSQIEKIMQTNIKPGVNLLVGKDKIDAAQSVYKRLSEIIPTDQIIIIPQKYSNTPTPKQISIVAGGKPFQSPSCLLECKRPQNFVSVSWDKKVNSCSYAPGKQPLKTLDFAGMMEALNNVEWRTCKALWAYLPSSQYDEIVLKKDEASSAFFWQHLL